MKYLGILVADRKLLASDFEFLPIKVKKRLAGWQQVSTGGRNILIDAYLSNIPNFTMVFYLLSEGIHYKMDMGRANFYWESLGSTHKYHMVQW
jgi:hypothetical protein